MALLSGMIAFGQNVTNKYPTAQQAKHSGQLVDAKPINVFTEKAEGDSIWGDDFSVPANWAFTHTSTPPHGWGITSNSDTIPVAALRPFNAPTADNGFAFVSSDAAGTQQNPSSTNANLTNVNPIDLTGQNFVTLEFYNITRNYASQYRVYVSGDNGVNWTEFVVNSHITTNVNTTNPEKVSINISNVAGGQSEVLIRFNYIADWGWFWAIDDVKIIESFANDIAMTQMYSVAGVQELHYTKIPTTQVDGATAVSFGAEVVNVGSASQDLTLNVSNAAGYNQASAIVTVAPTMTDSLEILNANGFIIPAAIANYDFDVEITSNNTLANPENGEGVMPFEVTDKIMAVDVYDGTPASLTGGFIGWATPAGDPGIGTLFEIFNATNLERVQIGIANVATPADYAGNEIFCQLFKYNATTQEYDFVAISMSYNLQTADFGNLINLQFDQTIPLNAGDVILPIACFFESAAAPVAFAGFSLANTTIGLNGATLTTLASDDGKVVEAPVVRLDFGQYLSIEESAIEASNVVLYPNPASTNATIAYSLNTESSVSIEVRDLAGKLVYSSEEGKLAAGSHNMTISTATLADGIYTYTLVANGAQVTNKFVVKK